MSRTYQRGDGGVCPGDAGGNPVEVTHSRERASHQLQKELPQKEVCIDKGRGPERQEGAFERFQILESGNSSNDGNGSDDGQAGWTLMVAGC